jgi:predicted SprT family Zn-dependent metalloprotease
MLTKADQLRARFNENDSVAFGKRKPCFGTIVRLNRTTATVRCDDSPDEYLVPFELLERLAPERDVCPEEKLETIILRARGLMHAHGLNDWQFTFDHSTRRAGCCNYHDRRISISFELARNATDEDIRDTILHEIAHALAGKKHNHDAVWKKKALEIGCSGERTHRLVFSPPRYHVTCGNRCWTHTAERRNRRLVCRTCGSKLIYLPYATAT